MRDWKAHLEYKESLVRLIIEMRKVSTVKVSYEAHRLKQWSKYDLEAEVERLRKLMPPPVNVAGVVPPAAVKPAPAKQTFASFMDDEKNVKE